MPMFAFIPFLAGLMGSVATFFVSFVTKKLAISLGVLTVLLGLTAAFVLLFMGFIEAIRVSSPSGAFMIGMGGFLPGNTILCISTYITARIAARIYAYHYDFVAVQLRMYGGL